MTTYPRAYLDHNASSPMRPEARSAMAAAMAEGGNPSSIHAEGRAARNAIELARRGVAFLAGVAPRGVTFTSGGTEAAQLALAPSPHATHLIVAAGEHPCVLNGHRFPPDRVEIAPFLPDGRIDLAALRAIARRTPPAMLALQGANNETGVLQPVAEAVAIMRECSGLVVCDAIQLAGRVAMAGLAANVDALFISAHKLGGPKGAGALIVVNERAAPVAALRGGGQERGFRAGTENVAGIAGFGAAALAAIVDIDREQPRLGALRDRIWSDILALAPDAVAFGADAQRLSNTLNFAIPGHDAQSLVMALDLEGVAVSSGAACSSGKVSPSHVLGAMGVGADLARSAVRISLGWCSIDADADRATEALARILKRAARRVPLALSKVPV